LEFFDGLMLMAIGAALMAGKIRGIDSASPGNVVAALLFIAAGGAMIGGRAFWPESERRVMWAWIGLLVLGVVVYLATNFR
jgi:hypothetical protein